MIETKNTPTCSGIYKITNNINNKVYIGQAKNLRNRITEHLYDFKNNKRPSIYLYKSMRKHGIENLELEILIQGNFTKQDLIDLEVDFIRLYNSNDKRFGYNLTIGGEGNSGYRHTQKAKEKMSKSKMGKKNSEEHKEKTRQVNLGKKLTEECKEKIRIGNTGKKMKPESIEKTRQFNLGKPKSEEHKRKLSEALKGHSISELTRERLSQSHKGKLLGIPKSEKHKERYKKSKKLNRARKLIQESCLYEEYFYGSFVYI